MQKLGRDRRGENAMLCSIPSSLRAKRSNPDFHRGESLDCFGAKAPRNDGSCCRPGQAVGWVKALLRRAHHGSARVMAGTLRFAHPTLSAPSFRGASVSERTRNLEIPGFDASHRPGMTTEARQ